MGACSLWPLAFVIRRGADALHILCRKFRLSQTRAMMRTSENADNLKLYCSTILYSPCSCLEYELLHKCMCFQAFEYALDSSVHIVTAKLCTDSFTFTIPGRELQESSRRTARHGCVRKTVMVPLVLVLPSTLLEHKSSTSNFLPLFYILSTFLSPHYHFTHLQSFLQSSLP